MSRPVGQRRDPLEGVDGLEGRRDPSSSDEPGARQREVLAQRADEDVVLLGDQRDVAAQVVERQLDQADVADGHRAGARRVDAREQPAERRLAGARRPDHRDPLADADVEVDAVQHVAALDVGEPHVLGVDASRRSAPRRRPRGRRAPAPTPSSRASEAAPICSSSRIATIRSTGSIEHLDVERRRGHLGQRHLAAGVEPAAEQQRARRSAAGRRSPSRGRTPCAAAACSARRRRTSAVRVDRARPARSPSPSASTVRAPSTVSASVAVIWSTTPTLAQVAGLGAAEVPPQADHQRRHARAGRGATPTSRPTARRRRSAPR